MDFNAITKLNITANDTLKDTIIGSGTSGYTAGKNIPQTINQLIDAGGSSSSPVKSVTTGNGLNLNSSGTLSMSTATSSAAGSVKVSTGNGLSLSSGTLSMSTASSTTNGAMTSSQYTKLSNLPSSMNNYLQSLHFDSHKTALIPPTGQVIHTISASSWSNFGIDIIEAVVQQNGGLWGGCYCNHDAPTGGNYVFQFICDPQLSNSACSLYMMNIDHSNSNFGPNPPQEVIDLLKEEQNKVFSVEKMSEHRDIYIPSLSENKIVYAKDGLYLQNLIDKIYYFPKFTPGTTYTNPSDIMEVSLNDCLVTGLDSLENYKLDKRGIYNVNIYYIGTNGFYQQTNEKWYECPHSVRIAII